MFELDVSEAETDELLAVYMAGAFLAGAMLFSGVSLAAANPEEAVDVIKHTTSKITYYVNGKDQSTNAGQFMNQGTAAPDSIIHNGTTYVPVRMVSDLVGQPVYWEQASRTISLGLPVVKLYNAAGEPVGSATLEQINDGVKVKITASASHQASMDSMCMRIQFRERILNLPEGTLIRPTSTMALSIHKEAMSATCRTWS